MDLDRCPKCGNAWPGGDKCRNCGFVPIGAGLDKLPKKKKKRVRKYVEPGSSRGLLLSILAGVCAWGLYRTQPWNDDWESVRALFGQGRHHDVVGEWEIEKTVAFAKDKAVITAHNINKGVLKFDKAGQVDFELLHGDDKTAASGKYKVVGPRVAMTGIATTAAAAGGLPTSLQMNLAWTGPDSVIAANSGEALFLRRHPKGNPLARLLQMGLKTGKPEAPDEMRGIVGKMKKSVDENGEAAN